MVAKKKAAKSVTKQHNKPHNLEIGAAKTNDTKRSLKDCPQCGYRFTTLTMFTLIMLGLAGSFYYFQQILENNSKDVNIQGNCGQISKMVLELNNKITALSSNTKSQADKGIEVKVTAELELSANKLNILKTSYKIKKLIDASTEYSKEQGVLNDYLKNTFTDEQSVLDSNKEKVLVSDQELVGILTKDMNQKEEVNKPQGVSDKIKDSVTRVVKVKRVEEKIMEQSFSNNINMAIVKILAHEYAEAAKYLEYTSNKPVSYKSVLDTLKAKAQVKAALDRIIDKTLEGQ